MLLKKICHIYQRSRNSQISSTIKADRFAFLKLNLSAYLSGTVSVSAMLVDTLSKKYRSSFYS